MDQQGEWVWKTPYDKPFTDCQINAINLIQQYLPMADIAFSADGRVMREPFVAGTDVNALDDIPRLSVQGDLTGSNMLYDERSWRFRIIDFERVAVLPWLTDILWLASTQANKGSTILLDRLYAGDFDDLLGMRPSNDLVTAARLYKKANDARVRGFSPGAKEAQ